MEKQGKNLRPPSWRKKKPLIQYDDDQPDPPKMGGCREGLGGVFFGKSDVLPYRTGKENQLGKFRGISCDQLRKNFLEAK